MITLLVLLLRSAIPTANPAISSLLDALPARCVGPAISGRVSSVAVYDKDPRIFYIGSASGGVFKTVNGGHNCTPIFDKKGSTSIGSVTVGQKDPNLVWVGTGESWQRNDIGVGTGVYKSIDGGKSWKWMGLGGSVSIGKIIIDPANENIVYAASLGSAWGPDDYKGVYKTTDGGLSWKHVLFIDKTTAAADLAIDPKNPRILLAAMWDHVHRPYHYQVGGPMSGIYRTTDGGNTWHKVKGLPKADLGRIAIDFFPKDPRNAAAVVESPTPYPWVYRSRDGGASWISMPGTPTDALSKNAGLWNRAYYGLTVCYDPVNVGRFYSTSASVYTNDGGKTFNGREGDDHGVWIDPNDNRHYITWNDGGVQQGWDAPVNERDPQSAVMEVKIPADGQCYGVAYDMRRPYWVIGNFQDDLSLDVPTQTIYGSVRREDSVTLFASESCNTVVDPDDWTKSFGCDRNVRLSTEAQVGDFYDYTDPSNWTIMGNTPNAAILLSKMPAVNGTYWKSPLHLRGGYYTQIMISPWNSNTLYYACNYIYKSIDRGKHWQRISPDLTHDKKEWQIPNLEYMGVPERSGQCQYQCAHTICESKLKQGLLWVGTDDGYVQLTQDDGAHWTNLTTNVPGLPEYTWVSHVEASSFSEGRAYVTFDGHKNVDYRPYVYETDDYGKTWHSIAGDLPERLPCYIVKEGLKNPDLLLLGTEYGLWISLDRGKHWQKYQDWTVSFGRGDESEYFPNVAVYDLQIHPREDELIIGTHGRSIWILPIRALEQLTTANLQKDVYFVSPGNIYTFPRYQVQREANPLGGESQNTQPGTLFSYYLRNRSPSGVTLTITDAAGLIKVATLKGPAKAGLNSVRYMWTGGAFSNGMYVRAFPGTYRVVLDVGGKTFARNLDVEDVSDQMIAGLPTK